MNALIKPLLVLLLAVLMISGHHVWHQGRLQREKLDSLQVAFNDRLHLIYEHVRSDMIVHRYRHQLEQFLVLPGLKEAVRRGDRATLLEIATPLWQQVKLENELVRVMHFHRPDGSSLLRMHLPDVHADPIASVRPFLQRVHRERRPMSALEAGKHGVFFRVAIPIFDGGTYVGAVEIGLDVAYFIRAMRRLMDVAGAFYVEREALGVLQIPFEHGESVGPMVRWVESSDTCPCASVIPADFAPPWRRRILSPDGRHTIIHSFPLPTLEGSPAAVLLMFQDLTEQVDEDRNELVMDLAGTLALFLVVLLVLNLSIPPLWRRVCLATRESLTDTLTGALNRKGFDQILSAEIYRSQRYGSPFCLVLIDVDNFKKVNDELGHEVGDQVLVELCDLIAPRLRQTDALARWGGDELVVVLPGQGIEGGIGLAQKLRRLVEGHHFAHGRAVCFSAGVAALRLDEERAALFARLDERLYRAKRSGRNRVVAD